MTNTSGNLKHQYSIRIIKDIHDPALAHHWKKLEDETDCFPQMYYEWCEPWWRLQSGNLQLHIVVVIDENKNIVGIAPMCIEKKFGLRILRSLPTRSVDFYSFIIQADSQASEISSVIVDYLKTFVSWNVVHLFNVNNKSFSWNTLREAGFFAKSLTDIIVADFQDMSFEKYISTLSQKNRYHFRNKLRKLYREGEVSLTCFEDGAGYIAHVDEIKHIYNDRWADDYALHPDDIYYQFRHEAVQALCKKNKVALFVLRLNNKMISFRLGFMHKNIFYEWKSAHDPQLDEFSPGLLITGKIIQEYISRGFTHYNFMVGDYPYKRSWAPQGADSTNYEVFARGRSMHARLYLKYRLEWRDKLKNIYHRLLENRRVRIINRWVQTKFKRMQ